METLKELRQKVKEKREREILNKEKKKLEEELEKGTLRGVVKKGFWKLIK